MVRKTLACGFQVKSVVSLAEAIIATTPHLRACIVRGAPNDTEVHSLTGKNTVSSNSHCISKAFQKVE